GSASFDCAKAVTPETASAVESTAEPIHRIASGDRIVSSLKCCAGEKARDLRPGRRGSGEQAAVEHQFGTGHVARCLGGEKQHALGDVAGFAGPCHGHRDFARACTSIAAGQIGVSMMPGCTELTRMLSQAAAHSIATALAKSRTA